MNYEVCANIGLSVGRDAEVKFLVSETDPGFITLVIGDGDTVAEISLVPSTVETLSKKAEDALRQSREITTTDVQES
jgi:hypothetical protein